jgi:hypothetical protein
MLREMSAQQFYEWAAFYQMEPWGAASLDYQFAHFKALYVNAHLKKGKRQFKPEKFLIFPEKKKGGSPAPDMSDDEDF